MNNDIECAKEVIKNIYYCGADRLRCYNNFGHVPRGKYILINSEEMETILRVIKNIAFKYKDKIIDVSVIVPNKVVEVTFADGDKQKSVCQECDTFSLEWAITICLGKHIMGSSAYRSTINKAMRDYNKKIKAEKADAEKKEKDLKEAERIAAKKKAKKEAYIERCKQKDREEKIAIQREAYIQAMKYMTDEKTKKDIKDVEE